MYKHRLVGIAICALPVLISACSSSSPRAALYGAENSVEATFESCGGGAIEILWLEFYPDITSRNSGDTLFRTQLFRVSERSDSPSRWRSKDKLPKQLGLAIYELRASGPTSNATVLFNSEPERLPRYPNALLGGGGRPDALGRADDLSC